MKQRPNVEFDAFTKLTDNLLSVPHSEIQKRLKKYKNQGPHKRGPKPKATSSVSRARHDET